MTRSALRFSAVSDPVLTVQIRGNVRICVPNDINLMTSYVLLEQEDWFEDEIEFVRLMLQPGDRVIDVGANYGVYALTSAGLIGPEGRVWAIEPCTETLGFLRQSVDVNGFSNVEVIKMALSDRQGHGYLSLSPNSELNAVTDARDPAVQYEEIETDTLDRCMSRFGWSDVAFIKIDAEGKEESILKGAQTFLAENSPLVMYEIKAGERVNLDLLATFRAIGYDSYRLVPGLNVLVPCDVTQGIDPYQLNLFACKPDRAQMLSDRGLLTMGHAPVQVPQGAFFVRARIKPQKWQKRLLRVWTESLPEMRRTASGVKYLQALDCYAAAQDHARSPSERAGFLGKSFDLLTDIVQHPDSTLSRLLSFARVASDFGYRQFSVNAYARVLDSIQRHGRMGMQEPMLPPAVLCLNTTEVKDFSNRLTACIIEEFERRSAYSSYFTGCGRYQLLNGFRTMGYPSADMERRFQLVRIRCGLSLAVEPAPVLAVGSDQNLNSHLWTAVG